MKKITNLNGLSITKRENSGPRVAKSLCFLNVFAQPDRKFFRFVIKSNRLKLSAIILIFLIMPAITFAFTRGPDGYNYYDYQSNYPIGGLIFGGGSFGGSGLFCSGGYYPTFCSVIEFFLGLIGKSIPILISISIIVFVWGVFRYVMYEGEDRQKSRDVMMYGIIGLFVMVSVWGLVALVYNTFGLNNTNNSIYYYGSGGYGIGSGGGGGFSGSGSGLGKAAFDGSSSGNGGANDNTSGSPFGLPPIKLAPSDLSLPLNTSIK
ncbi:MAG: hypothetical protein KGJ58_00790 [Patescibacteria group bacterium]|nr:hypothetical protein [Patescibacteria group bacterium]MDE1988160.1 hypothetical protein [Patescibacteria group bacterium]MDE2217980.1 hypothetical protein [Patescibacteria group bacterium]